MSKVTGAMPILAITMGDPAGVGPEIVLRAWQNRQKGQHVWLYVADPQVVAWTAKALNINVDFAIVESPDQVDSLDERRLAILSTQSRCDPDSLAFGKPNSGHAAATFESIQQACRLVKGGQAVAVVTPPINKSVLHAGGFDFPGHTEMLAHCAGVENPVMMLAGKGLRVVPATIHQSIRSVPDSLTWDHLLDVLSVTHNALSRDFGLKNPRIAVAGLNPHAGEEGAFGQCEIKLIQPLCDHLRQERGWHILGPLPADTLFHPQARARYDAAVCMYHDQALIPLKMLAFGEAVNITLGLPIVRTSVDHGTAYDIAGSGKAEYSSFLEAVVLAGEIAQNRL
ncbi:MAG: 4-hydroxythreonine-4-phosphate dehydrogenase PdxA [Magnetococcales bacterium]|nr:4-hydroxythreonine-4-phosphate dehydrogenase PdxA [Magnetococcales bacterium]